MVISVHPILWNKNLLMSDICNWPAVESNHRLWHYKKPADFHTKIIKEVKNIKLIFYDQHWCVPHEKWQNGNIIIKWVLAQVSSSRLLFFKFIDAKCGFTNVIKLPFGYLFFFSFLLSIACCEFPTQKTRATERTFLFYTLMHFLNQNRCFFNKKISISLFYSMQLQRTC